MKLKTSKLALCVLSALLLVGCNTTTSSNQPTTSSQETTSSATKKLNMKKATFLINQV